MEYIVFHGESLKWEVKYTKDYKVRTLNLQVRAPEEIEITFAMVLAKWHNIFGDVCTEILAGRSRAQAACTAGECRGMALQKDEVVS